MKGTQSPKTVEADRPRSRSSGAWILLVFAAVEAVALALVVFKLMKL